MKTKRTRQEDRTDRGHGICRTTISIPREVYARMKANKKLVNWSAVAANAFEKKLAQLGA